jgi:glycosyltransferase involved in cell wall biosynthesis
MPILKKFFLKMHCRVSKILIEKIEDMEYSGCVKGVEIVLFYFAVVAQLVERTLGRGEVMSSILINGSSFVKNVRGGILKVMELHSQSNSNILLVCIDEALSNESIAVMKDLEILGQSFSEVHIARFSKNPFFTVKNIDHPASNVWVYGVSHFPLICYISFASFVVRHLLWRKVFRPTHILSYGSSMTSYMASRLAKKYQRPLTIKIGIHDSVQAGVFRLISSTASMYRTARHLIVEGGEKAKRLSAFQEKIVPITPFFDFDAILAAPIEPIHFNRKYEKDFFFMSHFENFERSAVETVCKIMNELKSRYIKAGWIICVPYSDMKKVQSIIRSYRLKKTIFVEPERANMLPLYKGARVFVHTKNYDEFSVPVLFSLTLGIPTVTTPTGYVKELFKGTVFERFVIDQKDITTFIKRLEELVEKDYIYHDYKMNTPSVMKNFPHEQLDTYIQKIAHVVLS